MRQASFWSNLIGYEAVWFGSVIGAAHGSFWPGVIAAAAFVAWQLFISDFRSADARLLAVAVGCGLGVDGLLSERGWAVYMAATPALPLNGAPLWILTLWASFAMTINHSLGALRGRPVLAAILGGFGAPLAYLGAQRGWGAVHFMPPAWRGLSWLSAAWILALVMLTQLGRRLTQDRPQRARPSAGA